MRKVSMKGKRRKSEAVSESESEENGVEQSVDDGNSDEADSEKAEEPARKKSGKKARGVKQNGAGGKHGGGKRRKKEEDEDAKGDEPAAKDEDEEEDEYEVEEILDQRTVKGRRQFRVRWKGYTEDQDTWELEKDLNCPELIEEFKAKAKEEDTAEDTPSSSKAKSKAGKKLKKEKAGKKKVDPDSPLKEDENEDEEKQFDVEKIIEVKVKKNKQREFLIRWKGYSSKSDTWEPEENLNCRDLIEKFMEKVEKAKSTDLRELRVNRKHTKSYTVSMPGKRQSRRHAGQQRVTYHDADD